MIRTYARVAAVALLAYSVAGFFILGWGLLPTFYHAGVGLLFAVAGFYPRNGKTVGMMVGGLGVLLIAVKIPTILTPLLWGAHPQHGPIEITCLVVGITSILAAQYLPDGRRQRSRSLSSDRDGSSGGA